MRGCFTACSFTLLTVLASTAAGEVRYIRNDDATYTVLPANNQVAIATTTNFVNIYSSTPTTESVPAVTITGTTNEATLQVMFAGPNQTFPDQATDPRSAGFLDFNGLSFTDAGTQNKARLVVEAGGTVNGNITVGQVFRIRALGVVQANEIEATSAGLAGGKSIALIISSGTSPMGAESFRAPLGDIGTITAPNADLGSTTQYPIIEAVNIGSITAGAIYANIDASGVLNRVGATVGGIHGSVDAGSLVDASPFDAVFPIDAEGASTASLHFGSVSGSIILGAGLAGSPNAGILVDGD